MQRFSKRKGSRPGGRPATFGERFLEDQRGGKAVRTWARNRSFISFCWGMSPRNQTSCPGLDGQLWIQHDLLIAHALQNQTHYRVLSSSERFGGHSDILRDGWGKKSVGERVVSAIFGYMIY